MRPKSTPGRRGVTLIEMLVVVALVILIMTIIVSVFRSATGAVRASQVTNDQDQLMRRLEATLRQDLLGVTARLTPPLDPKDGLGFMEYGENAPADAQLEDADDWISFTAKAPEGQPFTGRYWNPNAAAGVANPIIISSEYAEILYFLRNGNLYRRVLLIVPERKGNMAINGSGLGPNQFQPSILSGATCGWPGVNDISAHPDPNATLTSGLAPVPNTLGDLTNRQNRFARPRFTPYHGQASGGMADDSNNNGVPDFYPTLYPNAVVGLRSSLLNDPATTGATGRDTLAAGANALDLLPFPFVYPGPYSSPTFPAFGLPHAFLPLNHSPLETGDSLSVPSSAQLQTYWGWPTWKETASSLWDDPLHLVNTNTNQSAGLSWVSSAFRPLPPMTASLLTVTNDAGSNPASFASTSISFRPAAQPFNDAAGSSHFALQSAAPHDGFWANAWEDDLIMTGVRSFDIKAFDQLAGTYVDLGGTASNVGLAGFQHEGRIPPLTVDARFDPQLFAKTGQQHFLNDDNTNTIRLTRVWDSWSTDYSNAPDTPYDPTAGPAGGRLPVYPSYPPPYPAPLRGIQIQIRIANQPDSDRLRVLTIRHDFSDKL